MTGIRYDAGHIARFFDDYGEREWERFEGSAMNRVNLEIHLRLLREHIRPGDRVLDAGAGPGRFTLELARLGATVVAGDISPRQLELHAERTAEVDASIESRELLDILDLSRYPDASFDAIVCYGGRLSYVLDEADVALGERNAAKNARAAPSSDMTLSRRLPPIFRTRRSRAGRSVRLGASRRRHLCDRRPSDRHQRRARLSPVSLERARGALFAAPLPCSRSLCGQLPLGRERALGRSFP